jgi:D-alanyl-D-alanine carboxypeptidase
MIIEKATGSKLSTEIKKRLWKPIGITSAYLSIQDTIPLNVAHVYGDNFIYGSEETDLTFHPRASHESITFGSSGIFTTSENLARWSHALFEGKILKPHSMKEMLQFIKFKPVSSMRAYGLGVYVYRRNLTYGKYAIGHGGGNIGTTTYMVYLPDYHVSIAIMVNAFPSKSADAITKGLIKMVLKELNAWSIFNYIQMLPTGLLIFYASIFSIAIIVQLYRKKVFVKIKY